VSGSIVILERWQSGAIGIFAMCGLGGVMVLTNPSQAAYEDYAVGQIEDLAKSQCDRAPGGFNLILQEPCRAAIAALKPQIQPLLANHSSCKNSLLFSLCRSNISISELNFQVQVESIGILDRFYTYKIHQP
jgi:Domain of unknown function (DUF4359)